MEPPLRSSPTERRGAPGRWLRRLAGALVALAVTTLLIGSAFFRVHTEGGLSVAPRFPLGAWLQDLPSHLPWVLTFALFTASMAPLRGLRWGFTLPGPHVPLSDRYHSVAIGLLANNAVPGKLGEVVRAFSLGRFLRRRGRELSFSQSLGTILVEKVLDLFVMLVLVAVSPAGPFLGGATSVRGGLAGAAVAVPVLAVVLVLTARHARRISAWLGRRGRLPRLQVILTEIAAGVSATTPRRLLAALGITLLAITSVATGYGVALGGAGVSAGLGAGVVILAAVSLGQSPPGVPAGLGMYYLSCSWAARALGATPEQSATLAVLTHLTTVTTHVLVGLASLAIRRVRLAEFLPARARAVPAPTPEEASFAA